VSFTYLSPASDLGFVRFHVGDTYARRVLLSDQEIDWLIATHGGKEAAVLPALEAALTKAAHEVDASSGQERVTASQRVTQLERVRERLLADPRFAPPAEPATVPLVRPDDTARPTEYGR
jgi:hypothetical protein